MTAQPPDDTDAPVPPRASGGWDAVYAGTPPWDIGRPQAAFVAAAQSGKLHGRLLDIGCGTGETTLLAAASGAVACGIDVSARAVDRARIKAADRGIDARFEVADIANLTWAAEQFDVAVDSGTFHLFEGAERASYVDSAHRALRAGGTLYLLCARADNHRVWGPVGLTEADLANAFADGWTVVDIQPSTFEVSERAPVNRIGAWFATITRR